jgi:NADH-quinone oxidoreductase subunit J
LQSRGEQTAGNEIVRTERMNGLRDYMPVIGALALLGGGVWWMMPPTPQWRRVFGLLFAVAGAAWLAWHLNALQGETGELILFSLFSVSAIVCAVLMITNRNPVYSALWFALATLSVCGLFWIQFAPFLAAATVIVYAGAIVVTFVFVIMLAQQSGATVYDQHSRQPFLATLAAFLLLGALLATIHPATPVESPLAVRSEPPVAANGFSRLPAEKRMSDDQMRDLGRSLFTDYLFAVELAGTILLVATIGAIAIAPRRGRGTL